MTPTPLIANGVYKIRNVEFRRQAADLIHGDPKGPISGYRVNDASHNQEWRIVNRGDNGDEITIESIAAPGSFATSDQFPGAKLFGSYDTARHWFVFKDSVGKYSIQSLDGDYVWTLPRGEDYVPIVLTEFNGRDNQKWIFHFIEP